MAPVKVAVWDLDGTIVDTETLCMEAATDVLGKYDKDLPPDASAFINGRRPMDVYTYLQQTLNIPATPETLVQESEAILEHKCAHARLMPGVVRLLEYFKSEGIAMVLATGTSRQKIDMKLKRHPFVLEYFEKCVGGDEVQQGKPHPEIFLLAAQRMDVAPADCLVFEDSTAGAKAAKSAGMQVVLVPSVYEKDDAKSVLEDGGCIEVLASLMDFNPAAYELPPFSDAIHGVINMNPVLFLSGTVVKGFGRGAKELGIRTANIDEASLTVELSEAVTGIYAGWASVGVERTVYKMVMSIGWNPFYKNEKKTAEAWLLHEFPEDFYGEHLRLLVVGYLRPEADFTTVENLISQIHADAKTAERYLEAAYPASLRDDATLLPAHADVTDVTS